MKLTNQEIYQIANIDIFNELKEVYLPAKINFFIQKNIKTIANCVEAIEKTRIEIAQHYGTLDSETNQYIVKEENIEQAKQELAELFSIEQELDIKTFSIEELNNISITPIAMQALMFMIED